VLGTSLLGVADIDPPDSFQIRASEMIKQKLLH